MCTMVETEMMTSRTDALRTGFTAGPSMEFVIAILAVTVTALSVMEPGSSVFALCVPMAIMALLSFDLFVCAMVFLLPWYPFIGWKLPVRDVFLLGRFVLLAGVWILQQKKGISLKNWLWEGLLTKG